MAFKLNPHSYPFQEPSNYPPKSIPNSNTRPPPPNSPQTPPKPPQRPGDKKRCFRCQGFGHFASECPNKRIVTLAEYQASCEEHDGENEEGEEQDSNEPLEEVEEGPDEGEMLVIRRALSGIASQQEMEQRENLFHTRCTIKGKVYSLIIDGGSCANVASKTLVEKLKLSVSPHPSPYTIQRLNHGKGLQISSRCLLGFSIGKSYKEEIWCDIVPMDACHVLLGRPWLFDRRVMHDGRMNTYTFTKGHKKITLTPLEASPQKNPQNNPKLGVVLTTLLHSQLHEFEGSKEWIFLGQERPR